MAKTRQRVWERGHEVDGLRPPRERIGGAWTRTASKQSTRPEIMPAEREAKEASL